MKLQKRSFQGSNRTNIAEVADPLFVVSGQKVRNIVELQIPTKSVSELRQGDLMYCLQLTVGEAEQLIRLLQQGVVIAKERKDE